MHIEREHVETLAQHLRGLVAVLEKVLGAPSVVDTTQRVKAGGTHLTDAIPRYLDQKRTEGLVAEHVLQTQRVLQAFTDWAGDLWVSEPDRAMVAQWRDSLIEGRSPATVNAWLSALGGFLRWAQAAGLREDQGGSPVTGLKLRRGKAAQESRSAFTPAEIGVVFGNAFWVNTAPLSAHRWLPLLMLFTGARPEELAQLRPHDTAFYTQGVPCIDLSTLGGDLRRKSEAARRYIPIHSAILPGLQALCRARSGQPRLFPELKPGGNGRLASGPSRWFNETWLRKHCGITDKRKVLYSLRHTVATQLKRAGVEESLIAELLGHSNPSITTGRYGKRYEVAQLAAALKKLPWGDLVVPSN